MTARTWTTIGLLATCLLGVSGAASASASAPAPARKNEPAAKSGARRLEDVYIEGEIPVPQVLFVTGRDQRRFLDFHHRRYLTTSPGAGRTTAAPSWIRVVGNRPSAGRKDSAR